MICKASRGARGEVHAEARPKFGPTGWAPGAQRRVGYTLGRGRRGTAEGGLRRTWNWERLCKGPWGARGKARTKPRPKIVSAGRGVKRHTGPQDGCSVALVGGPGVWRRQDLECGETLRGSSVLQGGGAGSPPKNSARRSRDQNAQVAPRRVGYSLGGGCGGWPPLDSKWGKDLRSSSAWLGEGACRSPPKNDAHR